ncbi:hypothetical protein FXO37_35157 [Capsicum annuum]|nr:hypothetical protein FXO37_35157 [Capsicum annuum]
MCGNSCELLLKNGVRPLALLSLVLSKCALRTSARTVSPHLDPLVTNFAVTLSHIYIMLLMAFILSGNLLAHPYLTCVALQSFASGRQLSSLLEFYLFSATYLGRYPSMWHLFQPCPYGPYILSSSDVTGGSPNCELCPNHYSQQPLETHVSPWHLLTSRVLRAHRHLSLS